MHKRKHRNSRKRVYVGMGAAMAVISVAALQQANAATEAIELQSGSFEEADLKGWDISKKLSEDRKLYAVETNYRGVVTASDGSKFLRLFEGAIAQQDIAVMENSHIRFRLDYRTLDPAVAYRVTSSKPNGTGAYQYETFTASPQQTGWNTIGGVFTESQGGITRFKIGPDKIDSGNQEVLVDNFQLEYAPQVTTSSEKTAAPVQLGSTVEVTSTIEHTGGGALHNSLFSVPLPAGVTYVPGSAEVVNEGATAHAESVLKDGGRLLEVKPTTDGTMTPGKYTVTYKVTVAQEVSDTFELKPTLFHQWAPKAAGERDQKITVEKTDFTVAKSAAQFADEGGGFEKKTPYIRGEEAVLRIPVTNPGPDEARNVVVRVSAEKGNGIEKFTGVDGDCVESTVPGAVDCSVAALQKNTTKVFTVKGNVVGSGTLQADAVLTATSRQVDMRRSYSSSIDVYSMMKVKTTVLNSKGEEAETVDPGEELTFKTTMENTGPNAAGDVQVSFELPEGLTSEEPLPKTWPVGNLEPGAGGAKTLEFTAKAPADTADFQFRAKVTGFAGTDKSKEKESESTVKVNRNAQLNASVSVEGGGAQPGDPVVPGASLTYKVKIANDGPSAAGNVVVSQELPPGFGPDPTYPPRGIRYDGNERKWTVESIPGGQSVELALKGRVLPDHPSLKYEAKIEEASVPDLRAEGGAYGGLEAHRVSQTTEVTQQVEMNVAVARTKPKAEARPGDEATWTVTASNGGPSIARGMEIANQLPDGVTLTSAKDQEGKDVALDGAEHVWKPADLKPGDTATLTITGTVPADRDTLAFTSSVTKAGAPDARGAVGQVPQHKAVNSLKVIQQADLDLTLTPGASGLKPGETGAVTVTVSNAGPSVARAATTELALPDNLTGITDDGTGSFDAQTGTWRVGDLAVGEEKSLTLNFSSDKEQESSFQVLALSSAAEDPNACVDVCASATAKFSKSGEAPASGDEAGAGAGTDGDTLADGGQEESVLDQALAATGSNALWWGAGALGAAGIGAALLIAARLRRS
ncbi:hypothetical protein ACFYM0_36005 [Streptomyces sp. NPDC006487]|uniref:hypothetical protein n=1 Tax=Streptomyces sp. NPDC006487 TaxID=3364748 RepID=UPI0036AB2E86